MDVPVVQGNPGQAPAADGDTAAAEAAFTQALTSAILFMGMNSVNDLKDQMSEMENELEE